MKITKKYLVRIKKGCFRFPRNPNPEGVDTRHYLVAKILLKKTVWDDKIPINNYKKIVRKTFKKVGSLSRHKLKKALWVANKKNK